MLALYKPSVASQQLSQHIRWGIFHGKMGQCVLYPTVYLYISMWYILSGKCSGSHLCGTNFCLDLFVPPLPPPPPQQRLLLGELNSGPVLWSIHLDTLSAQKKFVNCFDLFMLLQGYLSTSKSGTSSTLTFVQPFLTLKESAKAAAISPTCKDMVKLI